MHKPPVSKEKLEELVHNDGIVLATYDIMQDTSLIWFFDGKEPHLIATRDEYVTSFAVDGKIVYDAAGGRIHKTFDDLDGKHPLTSAVYNLWPICAFDGRLYGVAEHKVFLPFEDPECKKPLLNPAKEHASSCGTQLCVHDGALYYAENCSVFKISEGKPVEKVAERGWHVVSLCSFENVLYDFVPTDQSLIMYNTLEHKNGESPAGIIDPLTEPAAHVWSDNHELYGEHVYELLRLIDEGEHDVLGRDYVVRRMRRFDAQKVWDFRKDHGGVIALCFYKS